ncbi:MAG: T9SS type A sorting domain-containing protein [Saprospiraceae bacterium]|nr:T9SS type A sorting domain-containing protein [Saprospiraceae bacterium]
MTYSHNGSSWSDSYDDVLSQPINVLNGGNLYFFVSPFFLGNTGTYALEINISRSTTKVVEHSGMENRIVVYPNPAGEYVEVDLGETACEIGSLELVNAEGNLLLAMKAAEIQNSIRIPLHDLPAGVYFICLHCDRGPITQKFIHKP